MRCIFAFASVCGIVAFAQSPGAVSGRLTTPEGKPLTGFVALVGSSSTHHERVATDAEGAFRFDKAPAGDYVVCTHIPLFHAADPDHPYMDTCEWPSLAESVRVREGQHDSTLTIAPPRGGVLRVLIGDPQQLLSGVAEKAHSELAISVRDGAGIVHPFRIESTSRDARMYARAVPAGLALTLIADGRNLELAEADGSAAIRERSITGSAAAPVAPLVLTVRARRAAGGGQ